VRKYGNEHTSDFVFFRGRIGLKGNTARFLKYVNYFHWDRGPQVVLELDPIPKEVEEELKQFLEGQVKYDFIKKRKNSKELSVRKSYRCPGELSGSEELPLPRTDAGEHRLPDAGRPGDGCASVECTPGPTATKRRRRLRIGHAVHVGNDSGAERPAPELLLSPPAPVVEVKKKKKLDKPSSGSLEPLATSEPQRCGTSVKMQVEDRHANSETKIAAGILSKTNREKNDRVELGQLEVLSPAPRKRGRPSKVRLEE
jgi:hypothetical protein